MDEFITSHGSQARARSRGGFFRLIWSFVAQLSYFCRATTHNPKTERFCIRSNLLLHVPECAPDACIATPLCSSIECIKYVVCYLAYSPSVCNSHFLHSAAKPNERSTSLGERSTEHACGAYIHALTSRVVGRVDVDMFHGHANKIAE